MKTINNPLLPHSLTGVSRDVNCQGENHFEFILDLQSVQEIQLLWVTFLKGIDELYRTKNARLIYRSGFLFEFLSYDGNGIVYKNLSEYTFNDFRSDFDYSIDENGWVIFKRTGSDCIQLEIEWDVIGDSSSSDPVEKKESILSLSHIFLNQLNLLLRIKNFEYHTVKDDITLAYNQNYLKVFIQNEIERAMRYSSVFSIVFFDLDNLKAINDIHGHLVGTEILKEVAELLRSQIRKVDILSRFGGDEFVIVLLHADAPRAYDVCLRIKNALNKHEFLKKEKMNIKISGCFGISSFPGDGYTVDELIRKADIAMYEVKRIGKDGIKIFEGDL